MPGNDVTRMDLRREFVTLAEQGAVPFAHLCRRFGISRKTGYKWVARATTAGKAGLGTSRASRTTRRASPRPP